jgi:hypothetical protein
MTSATCGLRGFLSSPSAALQSSLESRLRRRLDGAGSTLFSLTWRRKATPAGRPYCQLAASALRTSDSDCGSWPMLFAAGWPTTTVEDARSSRRHGYMLEGNQGTTLTDAAMLAAWPTPNAMEGGQTSRSGKRKGELLMGGLVSGPTPSSSPAPTGKPGQLNPDFSRWLMGYSPDHLSCAPTAMRSSRKLVRRS